MLKRKTEQSTAVEKNQLILSFRGAEEKNKPNKMSSE